LVPANGRVLPIRAVLQAARVTAETLGRGMATLRLQAHGLARLATDEVSTASVAMTE
jgi:hypothetical protein